MSMPDSYKPMRGKTCIVTGATSGMGRVTAHALAERGATVIIVGRDPEKGAAMVEQIQHQTGHPVVEFMLADLSSQKAIRQLTEEFRSRHRHLHVLVNNAGALFLTRQESADGIEMTFALNHLAYFLLTNLLLDALKASAPARIINVSSGGHRRGRIDFDDPQGKQRYNGLQAYRQSKLANLLFTYELANRLQGTGVTVDAVNPGFVATNFGFSNFRLNQGLMSLLIRLYRLAAVSPEQGAQTSIYLAASPDVEGLTGKYFQKQTAIPSSEASYDTAAASRLWQVSAELTGLTAEAG